MLDFSSSETGLNLYLVSGNGFFEGGGWVDMKGGFSMILPVEMLHFSAL